MNNWGKFAEMLGLELEQEFVLTDADGKRIGKFTNKITENGILYRSQNCNEWFYESLVTLKKIIDGVYKAVPKPWKPKKGEKYLYYSTYFDEASSCIWADGVSDLLLWKVGNCFRTKEEAEDKGKEIMDQIQKEYEEA